MKPWHWGWAGSLQTNTGHYIPCVWVFSNTTGTSTHYLHHNQNVRKWSREFSGSWVTVMDEQRSGRPYMSLQLMCYLMLITVYHLKTYNKSFTQHNLEYCWQLFGKPKTVQQVGSSVTDRWPQEKPFWCILTHPLHFKEISEDFLKKIINAHETCIPPQSWDKSPIHGIEVFCIARCQKIQNINQLWINYGNCVLGHARCFRWTSLLIMQQLMLLNIKRLSRNWRDLSNAKVHNQSALTMPDCKQLVP